MLKLIIVDDERLDREGLKQQLDWIRYGISVVETAKNGFEALEMIRETKPDILITDVKMPGMSGLILSEKAIEVVPWIKIIFVSGFDDFEYVKSALRLNAYEYILKPVSTDELVGALKQAIHERLKEKKEEVENKQLQDAVEKSKAFIKQKFLRELVYGTVKHAHIWQHVNELCARIQNGRYKILLCEIDDFRVILENLTAVEIENINLNITEIINKIENEHCAIESFQIETHRFILILSFNHLMAIQEMDAVAKELAEYISREIIANRGLSLTVGIGKTVSDVQELYLSYDDSCLALSQKMYAGKGNVLFYYPKTSQDGKNIDILHLTNQLMQCIKNSDLNQMYYYVDYLFDNLEQCNHHDSKHVQNICFNLISRIEITLTDMNEKMEDIFGQNAILWDKLLKFETILDIRQWLKNVFRSVVEYLDNKVMTRNKKIVDQVIHYIEENYQKEITLKDIAADLYYSPNYLGSIFKEETRQGFIEYLTEHRMKMAGEILKQQHLKLYVVANMVGYKNISSFINQFKLFYKITPKEFRERC